MELFSITCDSCGSRLKVRKRSAIGQILTCPKCSSMVQVTPPDDWEPPAAVAARESRSANSAAATRESAGQTKSVAISSDFEDVGELIDEVESGAVPAPASNGSAAIADPSSLDKPQDAAMAGAPQSTAADSKAVLPNEEWVSDEQRSRQRLTLTIAASIGTLAIAIIMIAYTIVQLSRSTDAQLGQQDPDGQEQTVNGDPAANESTDPESIQTPEIVDPDSANSADPTQAGTDNTDETQTNADNPNTDPPLGGDPTNRTGSSTDPPADSDTESTTDDGTPGTAPPGFNNADSDRPPRGNIDDLIIGDLEALGSMMEPGADGFERARDAAEAQRRGDAWDIIDDDIPYVERPMEREFDVESQLNTELVQLTIGEMPLNELLDFLSQLGAVPIGLHASALAVEGITLDRPVALDFAGGTLSEALRQLLTPLDLTFLPMLSSVRILPAASLNGRFERSYAVADLLPGFEKDSDDIIAMVTALVAPASWAEQGGTGTARMDGERLIVEQHYDEHGQIELLLNRLRLARGLSSPDDLESAVLGSRFAQAEPVLAEPLTVQIYQPQRLSLVVRELNRRANVQVVVDWESLANEGWLHETELPLVCEEETTRSALRLLAGTLEAAYHIEGDRVFTLTSRGRYQNAKDIEFYDCSSILEQGVPIDHLRQRILSVFGGDLGEVGMNRFYYDDESQYVIARLNQGDHKALLKFLKSWNLLSTRGIE